MRGDGKATLGIPVLAGGLFGPIPGDLQPVPGGVGILMVIALDFAILTRRSGNQTLRTLCIACVLLAFGCAPAVVHVRGNPPVLVGLGVDRVMERESTSWDRCYQFRVNWTAPAGNSSKFNRR